MSETRQARWNKRHPEKRAAIVRKMNQTRRARYKDIIVAAKDVPCLDCGRRYPPYVMQFDHVRDEKTFTVGQARGEGRSIEALTREIAKCDVVCANCHAERTWGPTVSR